MAAKKNNKYAQKHTEERVLEILADIYDGLVNFNCKDIKTSSEDGDEEKYTQHEGYGTIEAGFLAHGTYPDKMTEWLKTWDDNEEVSRLIKGIRKLKEAVVVRNTSTGAIPPSVGIFLMKAQLGYSDQPKEVAVIDEPTVNLGALKKEDLATYIRLQTLIEAKGD